MKWIPDRKVLAGGVAGLIVWAIVTALSYAGVNIPADQQTLLVGFIGWLIAYLVPPSAKDIIKRLDNSLVAAATADPTVPVTAIVPAGTKPTV